MIKTKIIKQLRLSLEVFKALADVPLELDDKVL